MLFMTQLIRDMTSLVFTLHIFFATVSTVAASHSFRPDERQLIRLLPRSGSDVQGPAWIYSHLWWSNINQAWRSESDEPLTRKTYRDIGPFSPFMWDPRVSWDILQAFQGPRYTDATMGWVCMSALYNQLTIAQDDRPDWAVPIYDLFEVKDNKRIGSMSTRLDAGSSDDGVENSTLLGGFPSGDVHATVRRKRSMELEQRDANHVYDERLDMHTAVAGVPLGIHCHVNYLNRVLEESIWLDDPKDPISQKYKVGDKIAFGPNQGEKCGIVIEIFETEAQRSETVTTQIRFWMLAELLIDMIVNSDVQSEGWAESLGWAKLRPKPGLKGSDAFVSVRICLKEPNAPSCVEPTDPPDLAHKPTKRTIEARAA